MSMNNQLFELFKQKLIQDYNGNVPSCALTAGYWDWKYPEKPNYYFLILKGFNHLNYTKDVDALPFLLRLNDKYPDAPDILDYIASVYRERDEYISAIKYYIKLIELYPFIEDYRKNIEICKTFIDFDNLPETDESADWLIKKLKEIDEKYWKH